MVHKIGPYTYVGNGKESGTERYVCCQKLRDDSSIEPRKMVRSGGKLFTFWGYGSLSSLKRRQISELSTKNMSSNLLLLSHLLMH